MRSRGTFARSAGENPTSARLSFARLKAAPVTARSTPRFTANSAPFEPRASCLMSAPNVAGVHSAALPCFSIRSATDTDLKRKETCVRHAAHSTSSKRQSRRLTRVLHVPCAKARGTHNPQSRRALCTDASTGSVFFCTNNDTTWTLFSHRRKGFCGMILG